MSQESNKIILIYIINIASIIIICTYYSNHICSTESSLIPYDTTTNMRTDSKNKMSGPQKKKHRLAPVENQDNKQNMNTHKLIIIYCMFCFIRNYI